MDGTENLSIRLTIQNNMNNNLSGNMAGRRLTVMVSTLVWLLMVAQAQAATGVDRLDKYFQDYSRQYFGDKLDWRLFKAQGLVESQLNHKARSHRGAQGVMQLMPATYREIQKKNSEFRGREMHSLDTNIAAGICFNAYLYDRWDREVTPETRIRLMLASYNGGYVRVLRAFNKAGQPENDWPAIARHLPRETRRYVERVLHRFKAERAREAPRMPASPRPQLASK